jgi:hypothetical protein
MEATSLATLALGDPIVKPPYRAVLNVTLGEVVETRKM